jgi:hypothetical protein
VLFCAGPAAERNAIKARKKKVVVVLPAYNAEKTLVATYDDIPKDWVDEILLVDDCSKDRTVELARSLGIRDVVHQRTAATAAIRRPATAPRWTSWAATSWSWCTPTTSTIRRSSPSSSSRCSPESATPCSARGCSAAGRSRAGMPKWKYFANLFLTMVENATFYVFLSEYHSGLPRLLAALPRVRQLRGELRRLRLRHRDHRPGRREGDEDPRGSDPDPLLRRGLPDRLLALGPLRLAILKTMVFYKLHKKSVPMRSPTRPSACSGRREWCSC